MLKETLLKNNALLVKRVHLN